MVTGTLSVTVTTTSDTVDDAVYMQAAFIEVTAQQRKFLYISSSDLICVIAVI